jgi:hypothetical protein
MKQPMIPQVRRRWDILERYRRDAASHDDMVTQITAQLT